MLRLLSCFVLVVCFFFLVPNYKVDQETLFTRIDNGCLVYSLHHKFVMESNERLAPYLWSRILAIQFGGVLTGHAVNVFVYKNITFVYDPARGTFPVARYPLYDPQMIAEVCFPKLRIRSAAFIEPTITLESPIFTDPSSDFLK